MEIYKDYEINVYRGNSGLIHYTYRNIPNNIPRGDGFQYDARTVNEYKEALKQWIDNGLKGRIDND